MNSEAKKTISRAVLLGCLSIVVIGNGNDSMTRFLAIITVIGAIVMTAMVLRHPEYFEDFEEEEK